MTNEKKYKLKKFGPLTERRDYSKTAYSLPVNDLAAAQKDSFKWLLDRGIEEAIKSIYPIESSNGKIRIEYIPKSLRLDLPKSEFDTVKVAKQKGATYSFKIYAKLRKTDDETGEVLDQEVLFGELPLMTSGATFVINGFEKVVIAQLLRSPGAYFNSDDSRKGQVSLHNVLSIIPKYGVWLEIFHKTENIAKGSDGSVTKNLDNSVRVSIDKNKATSIATLLRALGMGAETIYKFFGDTEYVRESIQKDKTRTEDEALGEIYNIIRKGDRVTEESKRNLFANLFFNPKRYDLSKTGRYLINRKLSVVERIENAILAEHLVTSTGQVLFKKDTRVTFEIAMAIHDAFKQGLLPLTFIPDININVYGQNLVDHPSLKDRNKVAIVRVWTNKKAQADKEITTIIGNDPNATEEVLLLPDLVAAFSYYFNLIEGLGSYDDTDSLVNKRISSIGELLQNQLQVGLLRLERNAKERMSAKEAVKITPKNVTNNKLVYNQFKSFFNSSQLCQFMDQMNPLAELSNKRRVTSLGPGGLNRDRPYHEARDVHATHYGRLCPIETPEGPNIGLILNFAIYSRVNELGFIETPYFPVRRGVVEYTPVYLTASEEQGKIFAQSLLTIDKTGHILDKEVIARRGAEYVTVNASEIDFIDVSSKQITSIAASAIPFLENDDASRALMGANMQRQSVPLIKPEAPLVGTGVEADIAKYSASNLRALEAGEVSYVDSEVIKVTNEANKVKNYFLRVFERSNQGSVISQRAIVKVGDKVKTGDLITDGPSFDNGELAIGKNVLVAFSTWNGYNFEDAIILSEKLVKDDVYTSIHIEEQTIEFRTSKIGDDELTYELPNVSNYARRNLNSQGIINLGSEVEAGDVLVGRVSPKGEDNPTPEEKLIAAIFAQKQKNVKDTSLKVKHGHSGTVIDVQILSREAGDVLPDDIIKIVKVLIAQKRKIQVGDKMSGRHGNKGVISRVLPIEDMPHLADGTPVDILLNPLGVPSRMNIGQVLELHLGLAAKQLKTKFVTPVFDGIKYQDIINILEEAHLPKDGKFDLYDPISGRKFDNKVSVGIMYMLKLAHMVDDKVHARSVGPYSLITQQPLGGKTQNGGQRFGQMETWAVEAHGASNVLQELLTYKSDDIDGRNRVYNSIVTGAPLPTPGTPESFNVLAYELRGIGIKLSIETKDEVVEGKKQ